MIRVLHVFGVLDMGGAESRIMDIYRHIDRSRVQFDFVVHGDKKGDYEDEVQSLGGRVFRVPKFRIFNYFSYKAAFKALFSEYKDEFKAVHGHMTSTASIYLPIAKKAGVPECAAHARSAGTDPGFKGKLTRLMRKNLWKKADHLFACSKVAGISVFGQKAYDRGKVQFVPNAIRVGLFAYNKDQRNEIRKSLNIENKYVIGHVGRFHYSKNHIFLTDVFASIVEKTKDKEIDPVLLLVGEGPLMGEVKDHVEELGISDKVIFAGAKKDVYKYYNAMDFFLYPSRYEGLPGTVVEAQASGISCLISDSICEEVVLTDLVKTKALSDGVEDWADECIGMMDVQPSADDADSLLAKRRQYAKKVYDAGFDVTLQAQKFTRFYEGGKYE